MDQVIIFRVGSQNYALDLKSVNSIIDYVKPVPVPNGSEYMSGLINVRGDIYFIIDGGGILESPIKNDESKFILFDIEGKIGMHVQDTSNVLTITEDMIQTDNELLQVVNQEIIERVINHEGEIIIELSVKHILNLFK